MSENKQNITIPSEDTVDLRSVMRYFPAGVTVVTVIDPAGNTPCGMTVSSFTSVSLEPPLIAVSLKKSSSTADVILAQQRFGVSILAEEQSNLSNRFAGFDPDFEEQSSRFEGLRTHTAKSGAPLLTDALSWLDCKIWAVYDGSTHHLILGEVIVNSILNEGNARNPLIYHNRGYHTLVPRE